MAYSLDESLKEAVVRSAKLPGPCSFRRAGDGAGLLPRV